MVPKETYKVRASYASTPPFSIFKDALVYKLEECRTKKKISCMFLLCWVCFAVCLQMHKSLTQSVQYHCQMFMPSWQEASEFLCIKTSPFWREFSNKKIHQKPLKFSLGRATRVSFSKFRDWRWPKKLRWTALCAVLIDQLIRGQTFWEVICFTGVGWTCSVVSAWHLE